jgi:hypothetical protein
MGSADGLELALLQALSMVLRGWVITYLILIMGSWDRGLGLDWGFGVEVWRAIWGRLGWWLRLGVGMGQNGAS